MNSSGRGGFTLVEVVAAAAVIAIALLGLLATMTSSMKVGGVSHERAKAMRAAHNMIEAIRTQTAVNSFSDSFSGVSSRTFAVNLAGDIQLKPQRGDPDGIVGFVWYPGDDSTKVSAEDARRTAAGRPLLLPAPTGAPWTATDATTLGDLREDVNLPDLGLPRDINANGTIDATDVSSSAVLLPVVVVVEWQGVAGDMRVAVQTTIGNR
jgi:prepilin-type N-terminal cleavage/methylation domain-containing protein